MIENELKMMNALGSVSDYFFETESLIEETELDAIVCETCAVILKQCDECGGRDPDIHGAVYNEYYPNIENAQAVFREMCKKYGDEYEEYQKVKGGMVYNKGGKTFYELHQAMNHCSTDTVMAQYQRKAVKK